MDLKSILVKRILKTLLKFNDIFCFVMDFSYELISEMLPRLAASRSICDLHCAREA